MQRIEVRLVRGPTGLDFSLKGGREHGVPVIVSTVEEGGVADGYLEENDEIWAVNDRKLVGFTHQQVVQALRTAGSEVHLVVFRRKNITPALKNEQDQVKMMKEFEMMREKIRKQGSRAMSSNSSILAPPARPFPKQLQSQFVSEQSRKSVEAKEQDLDIYQRSSNETDGETEELPIGWSVKQDPRTRRKYYENDFIQISTWTDPRSLPKARTVKDYIWTDLPPGWEKCRDQFGCIYYVNHDNQTTHWDSPWDARQLQLLDILVQEINNQRQKLWSKESELREERRLLLEKNSELDSWNEKRTHAVESVSEGGMSEEQVGCIEQEMAEVVETIMKMNEAIEQLDSDITVKRSCLRDVEKVATVSFHEVSEMESGQAETAQIVAEQLVRAYEEAESSQQAQLLVIHRLEAVRKAGAVLQSGQAAVTPELSLNYLLQLPGRKSSYDSNLYCIHLLPDERTSKTNLEMRVDQLLLQTCTCKYQTVCYRLETMVSRVESSSTAWQEVIDELTKLEVLDVHNQWMQLTFRDKVVKCLLGE